MSSEEEKKGGEIDYSAFLGDLVLKRRNFAEGELAVFNITQLRVMKVTIGRIRSLLENQDTRSFKSPIIVKLWSIFGDDGEMDDAVEFISGLYSQLEDAITTKTRAEVDQKVVAANLSAVQTEVASQVRDTDLQFELAGSFLSRKHREVTVMADGYLEPRRENWGLIFVDTMDDQSKIEAYVKAHFEKAKQIRAGIDQLAIDYLISLFKRFSFAITFDSHNFGARNYEKGLLISPDEVMERAELVRDLLDNIDYSQTPMSAPLIHLGNMDTVVETAMGGVHIGLDMGKSVEENLEFLAALIDFASEG